MDWRSYVVVVVVDVVVVDVDVDVVVVVTKAWFDRIKHIKNLNSKALKAYNRIITI